MFPFIINDSFGFLRFSNEAIDEYNKRKLEQDDSFKPLKVRDTEITEDLRFDPTMVEIVKEFGFRSGFKNSNPTVCEVEERYKDYVIIERYNGYENFDINIGTYILDEIENVIKDTVSAQDKVDAIEMLLQERDD